MALSDRFGSLQAHDLFVQTSLLAAHGVAGRPGGFRPVDVRFFFLLFTNWIEHETGQPIPDLDLTQVRRVLARLAAEGWVEVLAPEGTPGRPPPPRSRRYLLTEAGLLGLAENLVKGGAGRSFEETLFLLCFCSSYGSVIAARVRDEPHPLSAPARRRVETLLDARRVFAAARRKLGKVAAELERRSHDGRILERAAEEARAAGIEGPEAARRLEYAGSYQLHHVRPLAEFWASLPTDVRHIELSAAFTLRRKLLFEPLARRARADLALLETLDRILTTDLGNYL